MARKSNPPAQPYQAGPGGIQTREAKRVVLDKALGDIIKRYGDGPSSAWAIKT